MLTLFFTRIHSCLLIAHGTASLWLKYVGKKAHFRRAYLEDYGRLQPRQDVQEETARRRTQGSSFPIQDVVVDQLAVVRKEKKKTTMSRHISRGILKSEMMVGYSATSIDSFVAGQS